MSPLGSKSEALEKPFQTQDHSYANSLSHAPHSLGDVLRTTTLRIAAQGLWNLSFSPVCAVPECWTQTSRGGWAE